MAALSRQQIDFLEQQGIPLSRVFNASGMSTSAYKARMKELDMWLAYGVTPCGAAGHTLRSRAGHCVQCATHNIAFLRRYDEEGLVYVARSSRAGLSKVGTTNDLDTRESSLCRLSYGGANDWRMQFYQRCAKAGRVEFEVHRRLAAKRVARSYEREGEIVDCQELFDCSVEEATQTLRTVIDSMQQASR